MCVFFFVSQWLEDGQITLNGKLVTLLWTLKRSNVQNEGLVLQYKIGMTVRKRPIICCWKCTRTSKKHGPYSQATNWTDHISAGQREDFSRSSNLLDELRESFENTVKKKEAFKTVTQTTLHSILKPTGQRCNVFSYAHKYVSMYIFIHYWHFTEITYFITFM
jgi:hypothetical protein